MASGVSYLRPSADISLGHDIYPTSGTSTGFDRINEEVNDGHSTHITSIVKGESGTVGSATSQFAMSGIIPDGSKCTGAKWHIVARAGDTDEVTNCTAVAGFTVDGAVYTSTISITDMSTYTPYSADVSGLPGAINTYILQNGTFPAVTLTLTSNGVSAGSGANKEYTVMEITQVYLELSYEEQTDIGVHVKIGGTWTGATQAYKKVNGAWVEITTDECKTILQNSFCIRG